MMKRTIVKRTLLRAGRSEIFAKLQEFETLQYIADPYARLIPVDEDQASIWKEGAKLSFHLYLFGGIYFGIHTIHVLSCSESGIITREHNPYVPVWNHRIRLDLIDDEMTRYTDEVEIRAGWWTPFVAMWANAFYAHRQKKWKELLAAERE